MKKKVSSFEFKVSSIGALVTLNLFQTLWGGILFLIFNFSFLISSAQPKNISSSEILHRIQGLKNTATVLYIAAHPDDENTRLISYLEKDKHYRVAYLSLTRGEGGQNLIGTEQGMDLGILRTQELLAARKIDGGEQFFSTAYDFGYSKTPEETLRKWDEKKVLGDIITVMNYLQPDIVICRFPTTGEGGHGHHTASAILAEKAFDSLVKANGTYVPKKLYWNTFSFGSNNTTSEDQLKIDVGGYNALLGKSYGEIAAEARSMHRCQAFGSERRRGEQFEYFKTLRDNTPILGDSKQGLLEGIKTDWSRFKGGEAINKKVDEIIKKFDMNDPSKSVKELLNLKLEISKLKINDSKISSKKLDEIDELILDCSGVYIEINSTKEIAFNNDSLKIELCSINRSRHSVEIKYLQWKNDPSRLALKEIIELSSNKFISSDYSFKVDEVFTYSNPYPIYESQMKINLPYLESINYRFLESIAIYFPEYRSEIEIGIGLQVNGSPILIKRNINYKYIDPSFGEIFQPLFISYNEKLFDDYEFKQIKYDHIPTQIYYKKKEEPLKFDYLKSNPSTNSAQAKIAYIPGAGDKIPEILTQMGYDVTLLDESNFPTFELSNFSTIITGVRAYNTQSWLKNYNEKLLKYVEEGGNLVIQYNTSRGLVADIPKPYPFELSRDRVTEEEAEVTFLKKDHPLLKYPNQLTNDDFKNWIQEFGLYFPTNVDEHYEKILSMHDTGESPNENSLIYCAYGKGKYIYTGLSFFRELPAGVSGATKLFVNLIEDNEKTILTKDDIVPIPKFETEEGKQKNKRKNK